MGYIQSMREGFVTPFISHVSENANPDQKNDFLEEINLMKAIGSHKNIVSLIGCCTKTSPCFLIVEFASNGDLLSYLRERRKKVKVQACTEFAKVVLNFDRNLIESGLLLISDRYCFWRVSICLYYEPMSNNYVTKQHVVFGSIFGENSVLIGQ